jgi:hypothetical protein
MDTIYSAYAKIMWFIWRKEPNKVSFQRLLSELYKYLVCIMLLVQSGEMVKNDIAESIIIIYFVDRVLTIITVRHSFF